MNEVQLLRKEIAGQRRRASEVAASWASGSAIGNHDRTESYKEYLEFILNSERRRLGSHLDRLRSHGALSEAERRTVERCTRAFEALAIETGSEPTLGGQEHVATDTGPRDAAPTVQIGRIAELLSRLEPMTREIEAIAERHYGVEDWRRTAQIDADSILEERRLREQIVAQARSNQGSHGPGG